MSETSISESDTLLLEVVGKGGFPMRLARISYRSGVLITKFRSWLTKRVRFGSVIFGVRVYWRSEGGYRGIWRYGYKGFIEGIESSQNI